jgi:phospholipid-translocating ATPase
MIFKKLAMEYAQFDLDNIVDLKSMLDENCARHEGPMGDLQYSGVMGLNRNQNDPLNDPGMFNTAINKGSRKNNKRREQHYTVRDLITCLALCHNVTPSYPDPNDKTIRDFQASSPDEVALVKFADSLGLKLFDRDQ